MTDTTPEIGCWYREVQQGFIFEVVAYDDNDDTVETQYLDGEISEYDMDSWEELELEQIEEPEDWRHPYELSEEDAVDPDEPFRPEKWSGALCDIEPDYIATIEE